jgi:hypothetical protein
MAHRMCTFQPRLLATPNGSTSMHVRAARGLAPLGIPLQELNIETVQPTCGADVEGVFTDLLDGRDACEQQEEGEMVREVEIAASDGLAAAKVLGFEPLSIRREDGTSP